MHDEPPWVSWLRKGLMGVGILTGGVSGLLGLVFVGLPLLGGAEPGGYAAMLCIALHSLPAALVFLGVPMGAVLRTLAPIRRGPSELIGGGVLLIAGGGTAVVLVSLLSIFEPSLGGVAWLAPNVPIALGWLIGSVGLGLAALQARPRGGAGFVVGMVLAVALFALSLQSSFMALLETLIALTGSHPWPRGRSVLPCLWLACGLLLAAAARGRGEPSVVDRWGFLAYAPALVVLLGWTPDSAWTPSGAVPVWAAGGTLVLAVAWMATSSGGWVARGLLLGVGSAWLGVAGSWYRVDADADIFLHDTYAEVAVMHLQLPFLLLAIGGVWAARELRGLLGAGIAVSVGAVAAGAMAQVAGTMWVLGVRGVPRRYGGLLPDGLEGATVAMLPGGATLAVLALGVALSWWRWGRTAVVEPRDPAGPGRST